VMMLDGLQATADTNWLMHSSSGDSFKRIELHMLVSQKQFVVGPTVTHFTVETCCSCESLIVDLYITILCILLVRSYVRTMTSVQ